MTTLTLADDAPSLHIANGCATITLQRPSQHNRIDPDDLPVLRGHLALCETNEQVSVIVLTGTGNKTFSSGYTLDAIVGRLQERAFESFLNTLEACPKLTIAAMRGSVYGGATDLALCCDIRLGLEGTQMFMPAAKIGLHYYPQGMRRYVQRLGFSAASQLFLTGTTIDAAQMLRIGMLTELLRPDAFEQRLAHYCALAQTNSSSAVALMKQSLAELAQLTMPEGIEQRYLSTLGSNELAERLQRLRHKA
jgi:methylglutaconyl-CoA hydratase